MDVLFYKEDIINALKQAGSEVTDDAAYAGVLTTGAILLGISEDSVNELISEEL